MRRAARRQVPRRAFAPTRVTVGCAAKPRVRLDERPRASAWRSRPGRRRAGAASAAGCLPANASGGGYTGPLAYRQGKPMRPDVAQAFDRMAAAARARRRRAVVTSGFRSDAEQARLFAANPTRSGSLRRGESLHRLGTELDLGPPAAYGWLAANAPRFGFVKRYAWEPWHFGYTRNAGSAAVGFGTAGRRARPPGRPIVRARRASPADRPRGAALERLGAAAGGAALRGVGLQPVRALARGRGGNRAVHAGYRARYGLATRSTRRRRSTPRRT